MNSTRREFLQATLGSSAVVSLGAAAPGFLLEAVAGDIGSAKENVLVVVQLSGGTCGYVPTAKAVQGGSYSAVKYIVGPEGGQVLVDETVKRINALWQ